MTNLSASSAEARLGAKPPSSPTLVLCPASFSCFRSAWNTSAPTRTASTKVGAPTGMIMNSWMSMGLSACAPPLMMFICGTGSVQADAEDGVGAEPPLVGRAVQVDQHPVERHLVGRVEARERVEDLAIDR